jgi:hypothetical protein
MVCQCSINQSIDLQVDQFLQRPLLVFHYVYLLVLALIVAIDDHLVVEQLQQVLP